jgi:group I intron endonuclease
MQTPLVFRLKPVEMINPELSQYKYYKLTPDIKGLNCSGIYLIANRANSKLYIGQSRQIRKRWMGHLSALRHGKGQKGLREDWHQHGYQCFDFLLWERCSDTELLLREQFWMSEFDPDKLYN